MAKPFTEEQIAQSRVTFCKGRIEQLRAEIDWLMKIQKDNEIFLKEQHDNR